MYFVSANSAWSFHWTILSLYSLCLENSNRTRRAQRMSGQWWAAHSYWHHPSWKILSISESLFLDSSLYVGRHRTGGQNRYCGEEEDTAFVLALNFGQTRPLAWLLFISFRTPRRDTPQRRNWNICASDSCICARNNCLLFVHLLETLALSYEQQYSYLFNK